MKILIAPDSFKNALSSVDVAYSIKKGLMKTKENEIFIQQLSDGGEGALDVILENPLFYKQTVVVKNPIGENVEASYAINLTDKSAFIESAKASGLELIPKNKQNPYYTSTYGVGEIILHAYKKGVRNFNISLGGSATNDGGAGILSALGIKFIGTKNKQITNSDLQNIKSITTDSIKIKDCRFKILVDVDNTLLGPKGATQIYAPQKGAKKNDLQKLENNLRNFAEKVNKITKTDYTKLKGSGAAGGIAFGLKSFFDVEIVSGISTMMEFCNLDKQVRDADLVISGEGSLDSQSHNGKLLSGIAKTCYHYKKPFIIVAGKVENVDIDFFFNKGCVAIIPIQDKEQSLKESINRTSEMLENVGETISDLIRFI